MSAHDKTCNCEICKGARWDMLDQQMIQGIQKQGFGVFQIAGGAEHPSFAYTIGLSDRQLPQLLAVGISARTAGAIVHHIATDWVSGKLTDASVDMKLEDYANLPLMLKRINDPSKWSEYMVQMDRFRTTDNPVSVLQVVFPDMNGKFPWESGYVDFGQPYLGDTVQ